MLNESRRYAGLFLLTILIMGTGLLLTYNVMIETTGWIVPPLFSWQDTGTVWELEAVGVKYTVEKEAVRPANLKAQAWEMGQGLVEWSQPILQEGIKIIEKAAELVSERFSGQ